MRSSGIDDKLQSVPQDRLDIASKERRNIFTWKGQFSPQLVEVLLSTYARKNDVVLDPFAGVGTTLIEAARLGIHGRGTELNPSAYLMGQAVEWVRLPLSDRDRLFALAESIVRDATKCDRATVPDVLAGLVRGRQYDLYISHLLANCLMRMLNGELNPLRALLQHCAIIRSLPYSSSSQRMFHADARTTPLAPESVNLVITSPPYINVFNYHENNRRAMELLGWNILSVARAELGSNRKNRGNRFLTVIQYCLDMQLALREMKRVLRPGGQAVIVIGRESKVRGISFENGFLLQEIALVTGFDLALRQERKFVNRFGQTIIEDILHLTPNSSATEAAAANIATEMLKKKLAQAHSEEIQVNIASAIATAPFVEPSPLFDTQVAA